MDAFFSFIVLLVAAPLIFVGVPALFVAIVYKSCEMTEAALLREELRGKGYEWVNIEAASALLRTTDRRLLRKLPCRDEIAMVPGYYDGGYTRLSEIARLLSNRRRSTYDPADAYGLPPGEAERRSRAATR